MKSNETALSYFFIREIIQCFLSKMHFMEENEIINHVLIELKENNVTESSRSKPQDNTLIRIRDFVDSAAVSIGSAITFKI